MPVDVSGLPAPPAPVLQTKIETSTGLPLINRGKIVCARVCVGLNFQLHKTLHK